MKKLAGVKAEEFYDKMYNPLYKHTCNPQFTYFELIEFANECTEIQSINIIEFIIDILEKKKEKELSFIYDHAEGCENEEEVLIREGKYDAYKEVLKMVSSMKNDMQ